jgi:hypothetical protein
VVDALDRGRPRAAGRGQRVEVLQPARLLALVGAAEEDRGPVGCGDGREVGLRRPAMTVEDRREQRLGALRRAAGIDALDRDGGDAVGGRGAA